MHMQKTTFLSPAFLCVPQIVRLAELGNSNAVMWWATSAWFSALKSWEVWDLDSRYPNHLSQDYCIYNLEHLIFPSWQKSFQQWFCFEERQSIVPRDSARNILKPGEGELTYNGTWYSSWKSLVCFVLWCVCFCLSS